jgi:hypothetical protein
LIKVITYKNIEKRFKFIKFFFILFKEFLSVSLILYSTIIKHSHFQQIHSEKNE